MAKDYQTIVDEILEHLSKSGKRSYSDFYIGPNGSNYQDYCIFFISLYRASPFAVSRYFCLG